VTPGREDEALAPPWVSGIRAERKYQSFRHDQPIGSFHPHHRAKWSTHELMHGLVGCAWRPDATPFFHATAGRLAELLPVALWYFFDEAFLTRCPRHAGGGALFRSTCSRCERPMLPDPDADGRRWIRDGLRFVEAELAAVARSRRIGDIVPHRWATIDLASDGIAYARAHGARLASPEMDRYATFLGSGCVDSLDDLEERVTDVLRGLLLGDATPRGADRDLRRRQDLAWRLLVVRSQTEGRATHALDDLVTHLADGGTFSAAAATYGDLHSEWQVPDPSELFAVGHLLPGVEATSHAFIDGLRTGLPKLDWVLGDALNGLADRFASHDLAHPSRRALALRFADFLASERPELADAARFEATVTSLPRAASAPLPQASLDGRVRCAPGVRAVRFNSDAAEALDALERGAQLPPDGEPTAWLVGRDPDGAPILVEIEPDWVDGLLSEEGIEVEPELETALAELGLIEPVARAEID
jgi:hypothetical protein